MVSWGCWAELVFQLLIRGMSLLVLTESSQSDAPGPKTDLRIDSLRPECPDANGPGP